MICDDLWCSRHCKTSPRPGTLEKSGARLRRKSAEILTETFRARLPSSADADAAPPSNFSLRGRPVLPHTGAKSVSSERSRTSATRRRGCRETRAFQGRCFHKTLHLFILPHTRSPLRLGRANAEIQRKMTNNTETQRNSGTLSGHEGSLCDNCIEHPCCKHRCTRRQRQQFIRCTRRQRQQFMMATKAPHMMDGWPRELPILKTRQRIHPSYWRRLTWSEIAYPANWLCHSVITSGIKCLLLV